MNVDREAKIAAIAKREQVRATVAALMDSGRLHFTDDEIDTIAACIDDATPLPYDGATAEDTARAWRHNGGIAGRALHLVRDGIPHRLLAALRHARTGLHEALSLSMTANNNFLAEIGKRAEAEVQRDAALADLEAALTELHPEALARLGRCKHCRAKLNATWHGEHREGCAWFWLGGGDVSLLRPQQAKPIGEDVPR